MIICLVNQYYWPDEAATARLITELSEDLSKKNNRVIAIASRHSYTGKREKLLKKEDHCGVRIIRPSSTNFGRNILYFRAIDYFTFWISAFFRAFFLKKVEIFVFHSTPPFLAFMGVILRKMRRIPYVYVVEDLYPEVAESVGVIKKGILYSFLKSLSRYIMKQSERIVVLGRDMKNAVLRVELTIENKIAIIPNWADSEKIQPLPPGTTNLRNELSWGKDIFIVMYSGNCGRVHSFDEIIYAMEKLRFHEHIRFLFVGGGAKENIIRRAISDNPNAKLLSYRNDEELADSLSTGDIHLVTLKKGCEGLVVPSKIYGIMAVKRPFIFIGSEVSEPAIVIREFSCGFNIQSGDGESLVNTILYLFNNRSLCESTGKNGREAFMANFDRAIATDHYESLLKKSVPRGS